MHWVAFIPNLFKKFANHLRSANATAHGSNANGGLWTTMSKSPHQSLEPFLQASKLRVFQSPLHETTYLEKSRVMFKPCPLTHHDLIYLITLHSYRSATPSSKSAGHSGNPASFTSSPSSQSDDKRRPSGPSPTGAEEAAPDPICLSCAKNSFHLCGVGFW